MAEVEMESRAINSHPKSDGEPAGEKNDRRFSAAADDEPMGFKDALLFTVLKEGDRTSPLQLRRMPRNRALTVIFFLFFSWVFGLSYTLHQQYATCSKENNCITCSITNDYIDGGDCQQLAATDLTVNAGCLSVPLPNDYDMITTIVNNTKHIIDLGYQSGNLSVDLYNSLVRHGEITDALRGNSLNQMINPDVSTLRSWFSTYFIGFNHGLYYSADTLPDSLIIAAGIKAIFSFLSIGCVMNSYGQRGSIVIGGDQYAYLTVNASEVYCPYNYSIVAGSYDEAILGTSRSNGMGPVNFSLPYNYIQVPSDTSPIRNEIASVEMLSLQNDAVSHCSTSVFTMTPATLDTPFFDCCVEKTDLEKLSEANAFAGLMLTCGVAVTTLVFWVWNPTSREMFAD